MVHSAGKGGNGGNGGKGSNGGKGESGGQDPDRDTPPFWEWVVAWIGAVLVLLCAGYLAFQAVAGKDGPPSPDIRVIEVVRQSGAHLVRVRVDNRSASTAEGLRIAGLLEKDGVVLERSQAVIQYLPGKSWRMAGLFFRRNPAEFDLRLVSEGFQEP